MTATVVVLLLGLALVAAVPFAVRGWRQAAVRSDFAPTVARTMGTSIAVVHVNTSNIVCVDDGLLRYPRGAGLATHRVA